MKTVATLCLLLVTCLLLLAFAAFKHHSRPAMKQMDPVGTDAEDSLPVPTRRRAPPTPRAPPVFREEGKPSAPAGGGANTGGPEAWSEEKVLQDLNNAFNADRPADANSTRMSSAIATAFGDVRAQGAHLNGVDCRATRCRLGIDFVDSNADKRVMSDIFALLSSAGLDIATLGFVVPTRETRPDGTIGATVHLFRVPPTVSVGP